MDLQDIVATREAITENPNVGSIMSPISQEEYRSVEHDMQSVFRYATLDGEVTIGRVISNLDSEDRELCRVVRDSRSVSFLLADGVIVTYITEHSHYQYHDGVYEVVTTHEMQITKTDAQVNTYYFKDAKLMYTSHTGGSEMVTDQPINQLWEAFGPNMANSEVFNTLDPTIVTRMETRGFTGLI